jgi:protein-tyrosine phosphatase
MDHYFLSDATVKRIDKHTVEVCWQPGNIKPKIFIFAGNKFDVPDRRISFEESTSGCVTISDLNPYTRYYFQLEDHNGRKLMTAERRVPLEGAVNFRDIGGYPAQDGRRVRWGRVFRSDGLSRLTDNDHRLLRHMGIFNVIDFRTPSEIQNSPDRLPDDGSVSHVNRAVTHGQIDFVEALVRLKEGDSSWLTPDFMVNGYINNIDNFPHIWGSVINDIAVSDGNPVVFHCTGGKDRTGTCAALILLALGVSREDIIEDHQLSNVYIADLLPNIFKMIASYGVDPDIVFPYLTAPRNCIEAMLDHIDTTYGSALGYLANKAGVGKETQEILKEKLLF